jgi:collagen type III alpha
VVAQNQVEFALWGRNTWPSHEVAGESYHEAEIRSLLPAVLGDDSQELRLPAALIPEPTNRHDRSAVMVLVGGKHVGYLPKEDAPLYQPVLLDLQRRGFTPVTECNVWAMEREDWVGTDRRGQDITKRRLSASIRLVLDDWWMVVPANVAPTSPYSLLPQGSAIQVQKEEEHQDVLRPFLRPQGEAWAYATLHVFRDENTRSPKDMVEVRLDGRRAGQLTPAMSAEFVPIIRQLEHAGRVTAAKVVVKGNQIKADVVLYAAKTGQLDATWIAANLPATPPTVHAATAQQVMSSPALQTPTTARHAAVPPKPTQIRFNPPPGWPQPPAGWEPYPGWAPPAEWPAAPEIWTYWILAD